MVAYAFGGDLEKHMFAHLWQRIRVDVQHRYLLPTVDAEDLGRHGSGAVNVCEKPWVGEWLTFLRVETKPVVIAGQQTSLISRR